MRAHSKSDHFAFRFLHEHHCDLDWLEARLLPYIRLIEWTDEAFEMINWQLGFLTDIPKEKR